MRLGVQFTPEEWDDCVLSASEVNPFLLYGFLSALERSKSAAPSTGWLPQHVALRDASGKLHAAAPVYVKGHSMGEYVFDHQWANLYAQLGVEYYPKLQCCVPFTPVTGMRVLTARGGDERALRKMMLHTLEQLAHTLQARFHPLVDAYGVGQSCLWLRHHALDHV
jgi:uncharacterized protein